jgi:hypothetical protein
MKKFVVVAFATLALAFVAIPASATSITYTLTSDHCSGGCGTSPFGTITLNDSGSTGDVLVTVSLLNGARFVDTGFAGAFGFNLVGDPTIAVTGLPSGFGLSSTTAGDLHFDGLGFFDYAITGPGPSTPFSGTLSFHVLATGLTVASFADLSTLPADDQAFFVADILGANGNTGPVGALLPCTTNCPTQQLNEAPEPGALILLASGLLLAAGMIRRRVADEN